MAENNRHIKVQSLQTDGIDLGKLKIVITTNWLSLVAIFIVINSVAYVIVRYTKNLYRSESILKLDIKQEASEFGIKGIVSNEAVNLLSGEIEIIQSRLFLSRVIDSSALNVSYYSIGRVLNDELYPVAPFKVEYRATNESLFNRPIYFEETGPNDFSLRVGNDGEEIKGRYNSKVTLNGVDLMISRSENFGKGDEIGYYFVINSKDNLLAYLLGNLSAEPLNFNANTLRISFKDYNPFKAQAIINKIDTVYLQYSNEQKNLATKQKIDWVSKELINIEKKMENFENYFESFTLQNKTNNLDTDLNETIQSIYSIDTLRYQLNQQIKEVNRIMERFHADSFDISLTTRELIPSGATSSLQALEELYVEQERLKLSYNENTFAYRLKQRDIETIRNKAFNELVELKKNLLNKLLAANQAKLRVEKKFANLPSKSTEYTKNQRFYKLNEQFYLNLMGSKSGFEIAQAGSIPDFKILSPATLYLSPVSPNKTMISGIGFISSIVLILLLIGALYLLNDRITSLGEIERMEGLPILGVVPTSTYMDKEGLHIIAHPKSMVTEAIKTLRTNLDFFSIQTDKKVIAVSSTVSGEGKSFIAMNLGGVLALSNKKVVLLDLDMRKPKINLGKGGDDRTKGISTILIRKNTWRECVMETSLENFDYIPSGPHPPNPSELLMHSEFDALLEELKPAYDYIILDTPPVGLVTDGIMAMKRSDISIYIFRANYSKKDFLFALQRIININKFSNITTLLNALPSRGDQSYGYGYYEEPTKRHWTKKIFKR